MNFRGIASLILALLVFGAAQGQAEPADKKAPPPLTADQLNKVWADFAMNDDAGTQKAFRDIQAMIAASKLAVPFLKERLQPVPIPDAKRIQQCIADLDGKDFKTREQAAKELEKFGPLAAAALEKQLEEKLSLDLRRRVEGLLERANRVTLSADELRTIRGIEVLRGIGSPEAIDVLQRLAQGADGAVVTLQARQALAELKKPGK